MTMTQKIRNTDRGIMKYHYNYSIFLAIGLLLPLLLSSCVAEKSARWGNNHQDRQVENEKAKVTKGHAALADRVNKLTKEKRGLAIRVTRLTKENAALTHKLGEQKLILQKLQKTLLTRHKEADTCKQINQKLIRELSQNKAKLAPRGSKLEAATLIAEATAAIRAVEQKSLNASQKVVREKAMENLKKCKQALANGNYENAADLSRETMKQTRRIDMDKNKERPADLPEQEITFLTPLQMKLLKTGNLRKSPSLKAGVIKVLPEGHTVIAVGQKQEWVKVKLEKRGGIGWLHLSLF